MIFLLIPAPKSQLIQHQTSKISSPSWTRGSHTAGIPCSSFSQIPLNRFLFQRSSIRSRQTQFIISNSLISGLEIGISKNNNSGTEGKLLGSFPRAHQSWGSPHPGIPVPIPARALHEEEMRRKTLSCPGALDSPGSFSSFSPWKFLVQGGFLMQWDASGILNFPFLPSMGKGAGGKSQFSFGTGVSGKEVSHWNEPFQIPEKTRN